MDGSRLHQKVKEDRLRQARRENLHSRKYVSEFITFDSTDRYLTRYILAGTNLKQGSAEAVSNDKRKYHA